MWIIMACQCISPEVTVKGFKKYCVSHVVDETDDMLWNGSEEDRNKHKEDESIVCADGNRDTDW
jgi:hypothetical protein